MNIEVNLDPLKKLSGKMLQHPAFTAMFAQWAARARSFWQLRFDRYSKGGGDWAPLSPRTIEARARRKIASRVEKARQSRIKKVISIIDRSSVGRITKGRRRELIAKAHHEFHERSANMLSKAVAGKFTILRDTGTLFGAFQPAFSGRPGQIQEKIPFGVRVGLGGPGMHDRRMTVGRLASLHQFGTPFMPARPMIVELDASTVQAMRDDFARATQRAISDAVR